MKNVGPAVAWGLNRFVKIPGNLFAFIIRLLFPVRKGTVMCWAYNFRQYSCNPRYLTEYMLDNEPSLKIFWVFRKGIDTSSVDPRISCVRFRSLEYYRLVNTAEFLITNTRTDPYRIYWKKRPGQKYLMLWHGGVALKKIEKDAMDKLGYGYVRKAKTDSKIADLMISGCRFQTRLLRDSFWYEGEILEKGIPRNDIFFQKDSHELIRKSLQETYGISATDKLVLYAPTFRRDKSIEPYRIGWERVIAEFRRFFNDDNVTVLLRLHPNLIACTDVTPLLNSPHVKDMTRYHDMHELLCVSDVLITDYSSSMFDIPMLGKPCMLYATDISRYDRGYYFDFKDLPFPLATNEDELIRNIREFDQDGYKENVRRFFETCIGPEDEGKASESITEWIRSKALK